MSDKTTIGSPRLQSWEDVTLIIIVGVALSYAFFYGPIQISGDDYEYVYFGWEFIHGGLGALAHSGVLGQTFLLNMGIGLFYYLFGTSQLTSTFFNEACFIGTIIAVYVIGSDLYNHKAGLLSALFYAIIPISLVSASGVSDGIPTAFFTALSMLFIIKAVRSDSNTKSVYYATASGFFALAGFLICAEAIIIALPVIAIAIFYTIKNKNNRASYLPGILMGFILAIFLIMSLSVIATGNPLLLYNTAGSWYGLNVWVTNGYTVPEIAQLYYATFMPVYTPSHNSMGLERLAGYFLPKYSHTLPDPYWQYFYGWFFYVAIIVFAITLIKRRSNALIPAVWVSLAFAYLIFGTQSLQHYATIHPVPRYTEIFTPAIALILGIGFIVILSGRNSNKKGRRPKTVKKSKLKATVRKRHIIIAILAAVFVLLFIQSIYSAWGVQNSAKIATMPFIQAVKYMQAHPSNTIFESSTLIPIQVYMDFDYNVTLLNPANPDCQVIPNSAYILAATNYTFQEACDFHVVAGPFATPANVFSNDLLDFDGIATSYGMDNITIYQK